MRDNGASREAIRHGAAFWPRTLFARVAVMLVCLPALGAHAAMTGQPPVSEPEPRIKAGFVINFLRFVEWPNRDLAQSPLVIATVGDDPIVDELRRATATLRIQGRAVVVASAIDAQLPVDAHAVFIARSARSLVGAVVRAVQGRGVLTIGDTAGFGQAGVVLNLYIANDRVAFEANTGAAARSGVRLSSHLLQLARIVG